MGKKDTKTKMKKNPRKASLEFKFNTRKAILSFMVLKIFYLKRKHIAMCKVRSAPG